MPITFYKRRSGGAQEFTVTGDTSIGSAIILNVSDTTKLVVGMPVSGTGIPAGSVILTIDSTTQITLDQNATANGSGVTLTINSGSDFLTAGIWDLHDTPLAETTDISPTTYVWALNDQWREFADRVIWIRTNMYTQTEIDAMIATENLWDRSGTTLEPHTADDDVNIGNGDMYMSSLYPINNTNYNASKGPYWDSGNGRIFYTAGNLTLSTNAGDMYHRASSGDMDFHDQWLSAPINLSESGETALDPFFTKTSIIGAINELANSIGGAIWKSVGSEIEPVVSGEHLNMKAGWIRTTNNLSFGDNIDFDFTQPALDRLTIDGAGQELYIQLFFHPYLPLCKYHTDPYYIRILLLSC